MSTYKSYIDRFNKNKTQKRDTSFDSKLNTDKESYTQFLEVQLERISQAILHVDSFNDKIETVCAQVNSLEEKLNNSNKLVKLLQSFADGQEADNVTVQEKLTELSRKVNENTTQNDRKFVREADLEAVSRRIESIERRMERANQTQSAFSEYQSGPGKDFEHRILDLVNNKIEGYMKTFRGLEERIEEKNDRFSEDIATDIRTLENRMSEFINRAGERFPHPITGFSDRALDDLKEDFYQKIEVIMDELKGVPTMLEIEELKTLLEKEVVERKESFEQVEKYLFMNDKQSTYNTEDVAQKIEEFDVKLQDFELLLHRTSPRTTEKGEPLPSFPERKFAEEIRKLQSAVKDLYAKSDQSPKKTKTFSTSGDHSSKEELYELEKRLTDDMVSGFDRFSQMIKKHMDKAKKLERGMEELDQRVGLLEENVPSRSTLKEKKQTPKNMTIHSDEGTPKDMLSTKENPFLRGRLTSESKGNTMHQAGSPQRKAITEGETSFGDRFGKLRNHNFDSSTNQENTKKSGRKRENKRSGSRNRSRSRSVSAKSLTESFISTRSGKENKSPGPNHRNTNYNNSRKSSGKKSRSRHTSPSRSASATPKRRHSLKSPQSFTSVGSQKKRTSDIPGRGSAIQAMQNKIEMERRQREEKIKKLLKKSKPAIDTPKFQPKEAQTTSAKVGGNASKTASGTKPAAKSGKNTVTKSLMNNELLDRSLKYDYNFTATPKGDQKDVKKYQRLDELYYKNVGKKNEA